MFGSLQEFHNFSSFHPLRRPWKGSGFDPWHSCCCCCCCGCWWKLYVQRSYCGKKANGSWQSSAYRRLAGRFQNERSPGSNTPPYLLHRGPVVPHKGSDCRRIEKAGVVCFSVQLVVESCSCVVRKRQIGEEHIIVT